MVERLTLARCERFQRRLHRLERAGGAVQAQLQRGHRHRLAGRDVQRHVPVLAALRELARDRGVVVAVGLQRIAHLRGGAGVQAPHLRGADLAPFVLAEFQRALCRRFQLAVEAVQLQGQLAGPGVRADQRRQEGGEQTATGEEGVAHASCDRRPTGVYSRSAALAAGIAAALS